MKIKNHLCYPPKKLEIQNMENICQLFDKGVMPLILLEFF